MTNHERDLRASLLKFVLEIIGGTELNPLASVKDIGGFLEVEYEDGTRQTVSLLVTDTEDDQYQIH